MTKFYCSDPIECVNPPKVKGLRIPVAVVRAAGPAALTFAAIDWFCRLPSGECFASPRTIGETMGLDLRTVKRHIAKLVAVGLVQRTKKPGRRSSTLTISLAAESLRLPWFSILTSELAEHPGRSWAAWCVLLQLRSWARIPDRKFAVTTGTLVRTLNLDLRTVRRALVELGPALAEMPQVVDDPQGSGGTRRIERLASAAAKRQRAAEPPAAECPPQGQPPQAVAQPAGPAPEARKAVPLGAQRCPTNRKDMKIDRSVRGGGDDQKSSLSRRREDKRPLLRGLPDLTPFDLDNAVDLSTIFDFLAHEGQHYDPVRFARAAIESRRARTSRTGYFARCLTTAPRYEPSEDTHNLAKQLARIMMEV